MNDFLTDGIGHEGDGPLPIVVAQAGDDIRGVFHEKTPADEGKGPARGLVHSAQWGKNQEQLPRSARQVLAFGELFGSALTLLAADRAKKNHRMKKLSFPCGSLPHIKILGPIFLSRKLDALIEDPADDCPTTLPDCGSPALWSSMRHEAALRKVQGADDELGD